MSIFHSPRSCVAKASKVEDKRVPCRIYIEIGRRAGRENRKKQREDKLEKNWRASEAPRSGHSVSGTASGTSA